MDKSLQLQKKKKTIISFVSFISGILIGLVIVWTIINNQKSDKLKEAKIEKGQFSPQKENDKKRVKGYKQRENCQFCQATNLLGLEEKDLPDLTAKERIGVINSLFVKSHTLFDKGIEYLETEWLEKSSQEKMTLWHEYEGGKDEHIIILKKTDQKLKSGEEVENKLVINFCRNEVEGINDYLEKTIKTGVKRLFEITPNLVWEWEVYLLINNEGAGDSNGVPLLLALYSAYLQKPIPNNVAATGAVDKEGNIGAIGGLREKIIAAVEAGNKTLILPADKNWNSTTNQVLVYAPLEYVSEEKLAEFNQKYGRKLKYRPVKNWKDLINLLEQGF